MNKYQFWYEGQAEPESVESEVARPREGLQYWTRNGNDMVCGTEQDPLLNTIDLWKEHNGDRLKYSALGSTALAVAVVSPWGDWRVYVGGVPGRSHSMEMFAVAQHGDKCSNDLAAAIFPYLTGLRWRN